jgi:tetratricopeptide (TPR) repeat protein
MVNAGFIYSLSGNYAEAELRFQEALSYVPDHEAALLNLALLYGETGKNEDAIQYFKRLLNVSDKNAVAAYNLAVLVSADNIDEAVRLSKNAADWDSGNSRYRYTYAYFTDVAGKSEKALGILSELIGEQPDFLDAYILMSSIYVRLNSNEKARSILNSALEHEGFSEEQKQALLNQIKQIE